MAKIHRKRSGLKARLRGRAIRMALDAVGLAGCAGLAVLFACHALTGWPVLPWQASQGVRWVGAALSALAALALWLRIRRHQATRGILRAGVAGEETALRQLARALPRTWHLFSNVTVAHEGRGSEMDLVAVGPGGVCVVEVKNYAGEVRGDAAAQELTHVNHGRVEQIYNPLRQVATHVHRLSGYLRQAGCGVWVRGAVWFVDPAVRVRISGCGKGAWYTAGQLKELAREICQGQEKLTSEQIQAIVKALRRA